MYMCTNREISIKGIRKWKLNDFSSSIISTFSCRCYAVAATNTTTEVHATKAADVVKLNAELTKWKNMKNLQMWSS